MSTESPVMADSNQQPDHNRSTAKAISSTAQALSDVASANAPGMLGKFGPLANLSAVALIGLMLWRSQENSTKAASEDRQAARESIKSVLDVVERHQSDNTTASNRQADRITKSVDDLAHEIRGQTSIQKKALEARGVKMPPDDGDGK